MAFKPLLAAKADIRNLPMFPIASPKIDGIRCLITDDGAVTRSLKHIPNTYIRNRLASCKAGLDGEIVTMTGGVVDDFQTIQSKVMRHDGEPDFQLMVFDTFIQPQRPYYERLEAARFLCNGNDFLEFLPSVPINSRAQLDEYEHWCVEVEGYEGIMLRSPSGIYKYGRSTTKEGILLKLKRFEDDEAAITGLVERMHNTNEAVTNAVGRTERSSSLIGKVGHGDLGAFSCTWNGISFEVGSGIRQSDREKFWKAGRKMIGRSLTFRYQGTTNEGVPRFPVFVGIREE